ncbi:hypothetical protein Tco_1254379 [Tanacetum coccineum]
MDEGTQNYSLDHIFTGTNPSVLIDKTKSVVDGLKTAHTDLGTNEESRSDEISKKIKLEDLLNLMQDTRSAFLTPDSLQDEPIIVLDERKLPAEFIGLPSQISSVQEKLKTLDVLPSLLHKVIDTLNRFATIMENASSKATDKGVLSAAETMTESLKQKKLKKFSFVTKGGEQIHLTVEKIEEQKRIKESLKSCAGQTRSRKGKE